MSAREGRPVATEAASSRTGSSTGSIVGEAGAEWSQTPTAADVVQFLIEAEIPVFHARANESYDPTVTGKKNPRSNEHWLPKKWEQSEPDLSVVDRWKRSPTRDRDALCMVCGHQLDAVDVDPKNGADVEVERAALLQRGVVIIGESRTPGDDGRHFVVASTGIGTSANPARGVDYKGGRFDETGRGFLYLPGTGRPLYGGAGYEWISPPDLALLDTLDFEQQHKAISDYLASRGMTPAGSEAMPREDRHAEVATALPVDPDRLPAELRHKLADLQTGPLKDDGTVDRSERFYHLVGACRDHGYTHGETVTLLTPWCEGVQLYGGRVADEVARVWTKVSHQREATRIWGGDDAAGSSQTSAAGVDHEAEPQDQGSSWHAHSLDDVLNGTYQPERPELMRRTDGHALLYRGLVHSVHGESESGKSLLMQWVATDVLNDGGRVLYADFESDPVSVVGRLINLGADRDAVLERFVYVHPEESVSTPAARPAWADHLAQPWDLVVIDGVTDAMNVLGFTRHNGDVNDQATQFIRTIPKRIATDTGAAVVLVDHVTKSNDGRGRFAIGAQAKMAGLTGAAYTVEVKEPLAPGRVGELVLRVGKDRPGGVRELCSPRFRASDRTQEAARAVVDSTGDRIQIRLKPPADLDPDAKPFRPTVLMQRVADYLAGCSAPASTNEITKNVKGKRTSIANAVEHLVDDGYVERTTGPTNRYLHRLARPYSGTNQVSDIGTSQDTPTP